MFDEEPDGDPHGECAAEIHRLINRCNTLLAQRDAALARPPVDLVLFCPDCGLQHVDAPDIGYFGDPSDDWANPPHRSHLCAGCGHIWRPADVPTNGVAAVKTKGKADSQLATPARRGRS